MRRISWIASAIITLIAYGLSGCGPRESAARHDDAPARAKRERELATEAMNQFLAHLKAQNRIEAEAAVLTPIDPKRREIVLKWIDRTIAQWKSGEITLECLETHVAGDWALVVLRVSMRRDDRTDLTIREDYLLRQVDCWKVAPESVRADAAIRPLMNDDFRALFQWYRENRVRLEDEHVSQYAQQTARR